MISQLLLKKKQEISVKLARITIYLTCNVKMRQSCNYVKSHRENCVNICNQTTCGTFVCFFKLYKTENLLPFAMFPM